MKDANSISNLNLLIETIVSYYTAKDKDMQGEKWKEGTHMDDVSMIPNEIDDLVKQSFIKKLKDFNQQTDA
jgi:hypothetical protein